MTGEKHISGESSLEEDYRLQSRKLLLLAAESKIEQELQRRLEEDSKRITVNQRGKVSPKNRIPNILA